MRWVAALLFPVFASLVASACGGSTVSGTSIKSCHASTDCATGDSCQFSVYASCGSAGVCVASPDGSACVQQTACSCSGVTETICLVNGNAPSAVSSLGSCDGAAAAEGFDASVPDATVTGTPDAGDSGSPVTPEDSGTDGSEDTGPGIDAADAAPTYLLGVSCTEKSQCAADPVYNLCESVTTGSPKTCTADCFGGTDSECQPPSNGACNSNFYCTTQ